MKLSQSTRILILIALIVAAVAIWYALFLGRQPATETATVAPPERVTATRTGETKPPARPPAVTTSARALQVLPIPFLVTEAPEEAPIETKATPKTPALAQAQVPPNPFIPLRPPEAAVAAPTKKPSLVESGQPVTITPGEELPENIPMPKVVAPPSDHVAPPPVALGQGTLPIKLTPLTNEVATKPEPLEESQPEQVPPSALGEPATTAQEPPAAQEPATSPAATGGEATAEAGTTAMQPAEPLPPPNPLVEWAKQVGLKLEGVALGPVSVAIFKTNAGYLTLPVGQTFPDADVLVKTITAERVLLVDKSGTNTLTLELGGGE